jgi:hypothetical protein
LYCIRETEEELMLGVGTMGVLLKAFPLGWVLNNTLSIAADK